LGDGRDEDPRGQKDRWRRKLPSVRGGRLIRGIQNSLRLWGKGIRAVIQGVGGGGTEVFDGGPAGGVHTRYSIWKLERI